MEDPQKSGARIKDLVCDVPFFFDLIRYIILGGTKKLNLEALNAVGKENEKILDIACGTCNLTKLITTEDYTGIDIHELFLQKAKSRFPKRKFIKMDGTNLKFKDKSFDKVIIMNFLHHLQEEEARKVLKEARRVCRGKTVIMDNIIPEKLIDKLFVKLDRGNYIRTLEEELKLVGGFFNIEKVKIIKTGFFKFALLTCSPKKH